MKKLFVRLGQWILKHKKRLIYGALALFIGQICFFNLGRIGVENVVYADSVSEDSGGQKVATEKFALAQLFGKLVYFLMYPILIVAGKLVDNSLVYGEVFGFDAVLWELWVIVRNIANFGLGFIFIFYIFQYLITQDSKHGPKWLIIRSLVAGVLIQASWFIMAALIDVSTIVTYGVGGLPLSVLKDDEPKYNPYVLGNVLYLDGSDLDSYHMYLSNSQFLPGDKKSDAKFISECELFNWDWKGEMELPVGENEVKKIELNDKEVLILGPEMVYYRDDKGNYYPTEKFYCHLGDQVYLFGNLHEGLVRPPSGTSGTGFLEAQIEYKRSLISLETELNGYERDIIEVDKMFGTILEIGSTGNDAIGGKIGLDEYNEYIGSELQSEWHLQRLDQILTGNYAGVFSVLYGSLLNAGMGLQLSPTIDNGLYIKTLNAFLSLGHAVAIAIPLIAMIIVFMMRIGVLWMAIALSPIIILLKVFGFDGGEFMKKGILKHFSVKNLIPIIFSPAVVCFAISMSTVLVRIINGTNWKEIETSNTPILGGAVTLNIAGMGVDIGKLVCSVIGIAITWFLVWAAVKSTSLGETEIIKNVESLAKTTLGSLKVVPIPGKDGVSWVGIDAAKELPSQIKQQVKNTYGKESQDAIQDIVDPSRVEKRQIDAYKNNISSLNPEVGQDWTKQPIKIISKNGRESNLTFNELEGDKKSIVDAINAMDEKKRQAFGDSGPEVSFYDGEKNVTYKFIDGKYVQQ